MISIPTIAQLKADILADLEAQYGESIPAFGKVFLYALAGVQAAKLKLYYLAIAHLQKNIFVDTADPEARGGTLERFGRIKLNRNPFPATAGQYEIEVTGTVGAVIASGTTFKSDDDSVNPGKLFILDTPFTLVTNPDTCNVRALEAGLDSQLNIGDTLTATVPIALVNKGVEVISEVIEPLAAENIEVYRQSAINAYRLEPQGGAGSDYRLWASDAQGVQNSYPYSENGSTGKVNLYIEATVADSTDGKGTPSAGLLSDVEDVIEFDPDTTKELSERGRRPLQTVVNFLPITPLDVDIDIADFAGSTPEIEASIEAALEVLINSIRPFVASVDIVEDQNDTLDVNRIISTILTVRPGSSFGTVTLEVNGNPLTSYTFENGDIPYLNSVAFS